MLYTSEYSAGLNYSRTNNLTTILHLVSIIAMLSLLLACNKIQTRMYLAEFSKRGVKSTEIERNHCWLCT
jgi:hypothetical protein